MPNYVKTFVFLPITFESLQVSTRQKQNVFSITLFFYGFQYSNVLLVLKIDVQNIKLVT